MFEEVVDAFFFHQPGDEIEVAFVVLHAENALRVMTAQPVVQIGEAVVLTDLLDDFRNALVLEDPVVDCACKQP